MNATTVNALLDFTLDARGLLEREVSEQLEGIYGLLPTGEFADAKNYPALKQLPEAKETRQRLEQYITDQQAAGLKPKEAREKLAREAAFTWLNRLVAFRMLEGRRLIRQTITKGSESNAFKLWLAEDAHAQELALYDQGDLPSNSVGEGPRPRAYRHFLLWHCRQLAQEIKVLFDADNLPSRFFPRPNALTDLIGKLTAPALADAWAPGNEETIGWVYQFFNAVEKKDVFDRLYKKKQKIRREDIPAATELFTPRWIVTWLVHNSLGRLWLEMHPDSGIAGDLKYLVPLKGNAPKTPAKLARDIALLDPACGTMHFGLVAFDVFHAIYMEELERAGTAGWPASASVADAKEIPAAIIAHNLFGIDLDLRAVQLSALCLYLKAKTANKDAAITGSHLACADISHLDDSKFETFLKQMKLTDSIYARLLKGLWAQLRDIDQVGSLLRLEEYLGKLIAKEREKFKSTKEIPHLPGFAPEQFETEAGELEFWEIIESQIIQAFQIFAQQQAEHGRDESLFTGEATKGLQVLDLMMRRYDVVAANPPYMSRRNMNAVLAGFLDAAYPDTKGDLYTAFIQRCGELLNDTGHLGMVTQQSFMFISMYEKMRKNLRDEMLIQTMVHLGPRAFDAISGEKVNTTMFVLRRETETKTRNESVGAYFRLIKEPDGDSKRTRFEQALAHLKAGQPDPVVFHYRQLDFDAIARSPWVYWVTPNIRDLFRSLKSLGELAKTHCGMTTSDNERFLRAWWELGKTKIGFGFNNPNQAKASGERWFPYMKGGGFHRWYGNQWLVVNWAEDGKEIREAPSFPRADGHYFRRGVTWTELSTGRFSARLSPGGFVFDVKGSSSFPEDVHLMLGLLNTEFAHYALSLLNPTVSFQVGDVARLPIPDRSSKTLRELVEQAIALARTDSEWDETTYDFTSPPAWATGLVDAVHRVEQLAEVEKEINEEVYRLYEIQPEDRAAIERDLQEYQPAGEDGADEAANDAAEPGSAALTKGDLAYRWVSYSVGIVLGRFEPGVASGLGRGAFDKKTAERLQALADADGILVQDEGHPDDLTAKTLEALQVILGEKATGEVVSALTESDEPVEAALRAYMDRNFFKDHIQQYRKRPVYWLLQSPGKQYGVWLFHERLTKDTLFRIRTEYVEIKRKTVNSQITDVQKKRAGAQGRDRSRLDKELAALQELAADLQEFDTKLNAASDAGYIPRIDDGVLLNMCPLWELVPSWQKDLNAAWEELAKGEYDWSHHAMDYWPDRVKKACKTNKSFAIAHGLA
jgi:Eco57I restriction-modification methylase